LWTLNCHFPKFLKKRKMKIIICRKIKKKVECLTFLANFFQQNKMSQIYITLLLMYKIWSNFSTLLFYHLLCTKSCFCKGYMTHIVLWHLVTFLWHELCGVRSSPSMASLMDSPLVWVSCKGKPNRGCLFAIHVIFFLWNFATKNPPKLKKDQKVFYYNYIDKDKIKIGF